VQTGEFLLCLDCQIGFTASFGDDSVSLAVRGEELKERADTVFAAVLRCIARDHRLEGLGDCIRLLWGGPEEFCDELVGFVSDVQVWSDGFQPAINVKTRLDPLVGRYFKFEQANTTLEGANRRPT